MSSLGPIAFLGFDGSFDYHHVGGTESMVRRLARGLADRGERALLLQYGGDRDAEETPEPGLTLCYRRRFDGALGYLREQGARHVISLYLRPRERIAYLRHRHSARREQIFHHLFTLWSDARWRLEAVFADARLLPLSGYALGVSWRLEEALRRRGVRAARLPPPVDEDYFLQPADKGLGAPLRVAFAGRLDSRKGTTEAVEALTRAQRRLGIHPIVSGFTWAHHADTQQQGAALQGRDDLDLRLVDYGAWDPALEAGLRDLLREVDVLVLPYRRLSSTVDVPLLVVEGLASLCAVITTGEGDLGRIIDRPALTLPEPWGAEDIVDRIALLQGELPAERQRLAARREELGFATGRVTDRLLRLLARVPAVGKGGRP